MTDHITPADLRAMRKKKPAAPKLLSPGEETFALHVRTSWLPAPLREYRFIKRRFFRFDFAWPEKLLAAEIEGGSWIQGRHQRAAGFEADCIKYNLATLMGWRVLRFTTDMVMSGIALRDTEAAFKVLA